MADFQVKGFISRGPEEQIRQMTGGPNEPNWINSYSDIHGEDVKDQPFVCHGVDMKGYYYMFDGGNVGVQALAGYHRIGDPDEVFNYTSGGDGCHVWNGDDLFRRVDQWPPDDNPDADAESTKGYGAVIYSNIIGAHTYQGMIGCPEVIMPEAYDFDHEGTIPPWLQLDENGDPLWLIGDPWPEEWNDWEPTYQGGGTRYWKWAEGDDNGPAKYIRRHDRFGPRGIKFDWAVRGRSATDGPTLKSLALVYWTPPLGLVNHLSDDLIGIIPELVGGGGTRSTAISQQQTAELITAYLTSQLENPDPMESKFVGEIASLFRDPAWINATSQNTFIPKKVWANFVDHVPDEHPKKSYWQNLPANERPVQFIEVYLAVRATRTPGFDNAVSRATGQPKFIGTILIGALAAFMGAMISIGIGLPIVLNKLKGQVHRMGRFWCAPLIIWGKPVGEYYESNDALRWDDTSASGSMYEKGSSYYCMTDKDWKAVQQRNVKLFVGIIVQLKQVAAADIGIKRKKFFHMMNCGFIYDKSTYGDEILTPPRQKIDQPTDEIPNKYCGMLGNGFWGLRRPYAIPELDVEYKEQWPFGFENGFRSKNEGLGTLGDLHLLHERQESFWARFENFDSREDVIEFLEGLGEIVGDIQEKVEKILAFIEWFQENKGTIKDEIINAVSEWWNSLTGREQAQIIKQLTELLQGIIGDQRMIEDLTVYRDSAFEADSGFSNSIFLSDYDVDVYNDSFYQAFFERVFDTVVMTDSTISPNDWNLDSATDSDLQDALYNYFSDGGYTYGHDSLDSDLQPAWWSPDYVNKSEDSDVGLYSENKDYDLIYYALLASGYDSGYNPIADSAAYDSYGVLLWQRTN